MLILSVYLVYPIYMYKFIDKKVNGSESYDEKRFKDAYGDSVLNLRTDRKHFGLRYFLITQFRRFIYSFIIVFLEDYSSIQILLVWSMSMCAVIILIEKRPFAGKFFNREEMFNELVIIMSCYHLLLLSDYVPLYKNEFRTVVGKSFCCFLLLVLLYFIILILKPLVVIVIFGAYKFYKKKKFEKEMQQKVWSLYVLKAATC